MELDFLRFFEACDPSRALIPGDGEDTQYYIDFSSVRGGKIINNLEKTIVLKTRLKQPSCQLFTGHIGCGKSTELRKLQTNLEKQNFHVVYFESTKYLDMTDLDVTDILLAVTRQVSESLEKVGIRLRPNFFVKLFEEIVNFLPNSLELSYKSEFSLPLGLGKITAQTKNSPKLRSRLRQHLEPLTNSILDAINEEVLEKASEQLKKQGKKGLVVIADNLDRVDNRLAIGGRTQPEYLFVDRGDQLRKLNCHVVYTIPLVLVFSNEYQNMTNRLGGGTLTKILPMIPVQNRYGHRFEEGLGLLQQMVLARAFPTIESQQRLGLIPQVFEAPEALDRLCMFSGGHVRNLLGILQRCLLEDEPPISQATLERAIREFRDSLTLGVTAEERVLLKEVLKEQSVTGEEGYQTLLKSLFVFEYQDTQGRWFGINPALIEIIKG